MQINDVQNNSNGSISHHSDVLSLNNIMSSKVSSTPQVESTTAASSPVTEDPLTIEFGKKILDGTPRSRKEISLLLKEMTSATGIANHNALNTKIDALAYTIKIIDEKSGVEGTDNASLRKSLLEEFQSLLNIRKLHTKVIDRMFNPTILNGGLDLNGKSPKEWAKDFFSAPFS